MAKLTLEEAEACLDSAKRFRDAGYINFWDYYIGDELRDDDLEYYRAKLKDG